MRCPRCGNENPPTNRFCGMCGTTLLQAPVPAAPTRPAAPVSPEPPAAAPTSVPTSLPSAPRTPALEREAPPDEPVISGPSFLGLNQPGPTRSGGEARRGSLSIDPNTAPRSRNLDYLLEDDEPKHGGGGWKAVVIFLALILAVGLGYLRWKNQGFAFLNPGAQKRAAPAADDSDSNKAPTPPAAGNSATVPAEANPPSANPAPPAGTSPNTTTPATPNGAPASTAPAGQAGANPAPANPAPANPASANARSANASPANETTGAPASSPAAPKSPSQAATPVPDSSSNGTSSGSAANSSPANSTDDGDQPAKPAAVVPKLKPVDSVAEAHKYLYGDGVTQNCDRGLKLLKPAADRANTRAMVEMGALYSAGLCTPKDLPTAYRWFAMALRKEPDNNDVQADLQKLWGEMTQPERQLAIKLSQ